MSDKLRFWLEEAKRKISIGTDCYNELYQVQLFHLNKAAELPYEVEIKISTAKDCCKSCSKLAERIYSLDEAFKLMPIPNKKCNHHSYSHCRCRYIAEPKRDSEGNLIMKY